jgi:GxxExxY protein
MLLFDTPLCRTVIGAAISVHRSLGPGLLESAYGQCLALELTNLQVTFDREVAIPIDYQLARIDCAYRADFLVGQELIVEVKSVAAIAPIHVAQVMTYLRLLRLEHGLIINFNVRRLKDGLRSVVWFANREISSEVPGGQE